MRTHIVLRMQDVLTDNDTAGFELASALWQRGEVAKAEAILRDIVARVPAHEDSTMLLAEVLRGQGRLDAASRAVFEFCSARGFDLQASLRGARFIQECQRQQMADEVCRKALARESASPELWNLAGNIARELGEFERARRCYLASLDNGVDLNRHAVLGALAHTTHYADLSHPDFARFVRHFNDAASPAHARATTGFGLAKAYDDVGRYDSAAQILRQANAWMRAEQQWDPAAWTDFVRSRMRGRMAHARVTASADFVPIFVVGLPRTGTTLTAAQLSKHSAARDRGELRILRFIAGTLINGGHLEDPGAIEEAAQLYRVHARQDDEPATWYLDQDPLNFRYLDIAAAMFPQARMIVCRRNRRDTALSLWSQDFAHPDCAFAYDFADIAHYAAGYDDLMRHWQRTLPVPMHTMDYESLVADPQGTLESLREFVGAPRVDANAAAGPAPINSSSVWQARQPIYSTSVGRWRGYLPYIPELAQFAE